MAWRITIFQISWQQPEIPAWRYPRARIVHTEWVCKPAWSTSSLQWYGKHRNISYIWVHFSWFPITMSGIAVAECNQASCDRLQVCTKVYRCLWWHPRWRRNDAAGQVLVINPWGWKRMHTSVVAEKYILDIKYGLSPNTMATVYAGLTAR